ncbi:MAG: ATP-binding protein [Alphaproteobacteria bacterium]
MSNSDSSPPELRGTAASCDDSGRITAVLRDDLGMLAGRPRRFDEVVDQPDRPKFAAFLAAAAARQPTFNCSLKVMLQASVETLCFGATSTEGRIVIFVARDRASLAQLNDALTATAPNRPENPVPTLLEPAEQRPQRAEQDLALYDDLSRLNNELAVTQRRLIKANALLDRANRELRAFYESLHVGIFRADATGRIEQANQRFCVLTGTSMPDHWLSRVHPTDSETVHKLWHETIGHGSSFDSVHRQMIEGGLPKYVEMKAVALRDEHDKTTGIVGVAEDVSERLLAEEHAREIARYSAIQGLTGGLAHNLNNIMSILLGTAEQLCDDLAPELPAHKTATQNLKATERAADLTHRLLIYSGRDARVSERRMKVDDVLTAIFRTCQEVTGKYRFVVKLGATDAAISINEKLFHETIQELISNAEAAMPKGGVIDVSTALEFDGTDPTWTVVVIGLRDHGVGMDAKTLRQAKEPFFTTREVGQGMGLGLSLADGAARMARGNLTLRSQVGLGTTAELRFPVVTRIPAASETPP